MGKAFDPASVSGDDPEGYLECLSCGRSEREVVAVGLHCWLTCDGCGFAEYWGYGVSTMGEDDSDSKRVQAMLTLSAYKVRPEHESAMKRTQRAVQETLRRVEGDYGDLWTGG